MTTPTEFDGHNPVLNIFSTGSGGSIQDGGPFYNCVKCDGRVMMLLDERGIEAPTHVAPEGAPAFEVIGDSPRA